MTVPNTLNSPASAADIGCRHRASSNCPNNTKAAPAARRTQATTTPAHLDDAFTERLNRLFTAVHAPDGQPYSNAEVVHYMRARGYEISHPYLSQLRNGHRDCPSPTIIRGLTSFFGVPLGYLAGESNVYTRNIDRELCWAATFRDARLRELITMVMELSPGAQSELFSYVDDLAHSVMRRDPSTNRAAQTGLISAGTPRLA